MSGRHVFWGLSWAPDYPTNWPCVSRPTHRSSLEPSMLACCGQSSQPKLVLLVGRMACKELLHLRRSGSASTPIDVYQSTARNCPAPAQTTETRSRPYRQPQLQGHVSCDFDTALDCVEALRIPEAKEAKLPTHSDTVILQQVRLKPCQVRYSTRN